jgi:hypothetical protein
LLAPAFVSPGRQHPGQGQRICRTL